MSAIERKDAVNEIRLMASIKHENVVKYHEAILDGAFSFPTSPRCLSKSFPA